MSDNKVMNYIQSHQLMKMITISVVVLGFSFGIDQLPYRGGFDVIDAVAQTNIENSLIRTTELFMIAKSINSILSVAKTGSVSVGAGISGTVTPMAFLDPLDQLIDDFSDWLLEGMAALSIIELSMLTIHQVGMFGFLLVAIPFFVIASYHKNRSEDESARYVKLSKTIISLIIFVRIGIPIAFIAISPIANGVLNKAYANATNDLKKFEISTDDPFSQEFLSKAKDTAKSIATNARQFFRSLGVITAILFMQILILPLLMTWVSWRFCRWIFSQL